MLTYLELAIETLIDRGARLDQIEEHIDDLALDGEQRSALWLLAWVKTTNPSARNPRHVDLT